MKITKTRITIERFTERIAYRPGALFSEDRNAAAEGSPCRLSVAESESAEILPLDTVNKDLKTEGDNL